MRAYQMAVTAYGLTLERDLGHTPVHRGMGTQWDGIGSHRIHLVATTEVPTPTLDWMAKSSINRRVPGSPRPKPLPVVYPSCMASSMLGIPGPSSRASMRNPLLVPRSEERRV